MFPIKHIAFALLFLLLSCKKEEKPAAEYLGVVNIEVTGKEEAKTHFEKGLLLLHSFEYQDARESFQMAQEKDPDMPMAYGRQIRIVPSR